MAKTATTTALRDNAETEAAAVATEATTQADNAAAVAEAEANPDGIDFVSNDATPAEYLEVIRQGEPQRIKGKRFARALSRAWQPTGNKLADAMTANVRKLLGLIFKTHWANLDGGQKQIHAFSVEYGAKLRDKLTKDGQSTMREMAHASLDAQLDILESGLLHGNTVTLPMRTMPDGSKMQERYSAQVGRMLSDLGLKGDVKTIQADTAMHGQAIIDSVSE